MASRILGAISLIFISLCFSQIGTVKIAETEKKTQYDSTKNFLKDTPELYVGTKLYLPGLAKELRELGYRDFKTKIKEEYDHSKNVYKCCSKESKFNSNYDSLAGRSFKVIEVSKKKGIGGDRIGEYIFKLQNISDNSIAYFAYNARFEMSFPFIDMRYFEKIKSRSIGKSFLVKENSFDIGEKITDVDNKNIDSAWKYEWRCIDVVVEEKYFVLSLLLQNSSGIKIVFDTEDIGDEQFIIPVEKAHKYKGQFKSYWDSILQNKVAIGMTEEMVKLTWGLPETVNQTVTSGQVSNQWVFKSRNMVYFSNGKVTAIQ